MSRVWSLVFATSRMKSGFIAQLTAARRSIMLKRLLGRRILNELKYRAAQSRAAERGRADRAPLTPETRAGGDK